MGILSCGTCGVPRQVIFTNQWTDDGLLISKPIGQRTLVLLERELIVGIIGGIEEKLGLPLDHIVIEAKRMDARIYVDSITGGALGKVLRSPPLRRLAWSFIIRQGATIGLGKAQLLKYKPGRSLVGRADPVYQPTLFAGDVQGAYESFERMRSKLQTCFLGDLLLSAAGNLAGRARGNTAQGGGGLAGARPGRIRALPGLRGAGRNKQAALGEFHRQGHRYRYRRVALHHGKGGRQRRLPRTRKGAGRGYTPPHRRYHLRLLPAPAGGSPARRPGRPGLHQSPGPGSAGYGRSRLPAARGRPALPQWIQRSRTGRHHRRRLRG